MFRSVEAGREIVVLTAVACLAGCMSESSSIPGHPASGAFSVVLKPNAQHYGDDVYSSQPYSNNATVYKRSGTSLTPEETISTDIATPQGSVVTPNGWWYLANAGDSNVLIYRAKKNGPKGPVGKLSDNGQIPVNVDVTPDRKLVAVSNGTSPSSGTGSVSVYLNRKSSPGRVLTYGNDLLEGEGVAIDRAGNCFWSFNDLSKPSASAAIVEFSGCNGAGTLLPTPAIASAGGLTFDANGNLYYIDEATGIYKCRMTAYCKLFATGFGLPVNLNFDAKGQYLWVADASGYLDAVDPAYGQIVSQTISIDGDPYGIAPAPGI